VGHNSLLFDESTGEWRIKLADHDTCSIYGLIAYSQSFRFLGFEDREKDSPTYGCFDRYYWHYRQTDFVNVRMQETTLFLALLYNYNHPENRFYRKDKIAEWSRAGIQFWTKIQRPDGSFDEYWPYERSFCATAFAAYAVAESCRLLNAPPPKDALLKVCQWIDAHENLLVLNQMSGAGIALYVSGLVLEDEQICSWGKRKIQQVVERQDPSGFFVEYGGYDIGYLTITLSCLSKYYLFTGEQSVKEAILKGFAFLEEKIAENGTFDYRSTSRKTQYFYPFGFRALEHWELLNRHIRGLRNNEVLNPSWLDDRYSLPLAIDYLETAMLDVQPYH
jgi:hypothetical protein